MAEQPREWQSREELEFLSHWRRLIDRLGGSGGQKRVAEIMDWTTSTVSRDYQGITLASDKRLKELCHYLNLAESQRYELKILLKHARDARYARRKADRHSQSAHAPALTPVREEPDVGATVIRPARPLRYRLSRRPRTAVVAIVIAVLAAMVSGVLAWSLQDGARTGPAVLGSYPGERLQTVAVPVKSLGQRATEFHGAATVTGYEFRSAQDTSLCLTAADTGSTAGEKRDPVEVAPCRLAANQIWVPEQWEANGSAFTHLISAKYPSKCLNAKKPLSSGQSVMLWDCYRANNESWDFGDWYRNVKEEHAYPILLHTARLCLDVDNTYGASGAVDIQTQQAALNQFWS